MKIVIPQDLNLNEEEQLRLSKLGEFVYYKDLAQNYDEWLERCSTADIICTGKFGLKQKVYDLKNVFISLPFVGTNFLDIEKLKAKNIKVARCPGCNKEAVSEWIIFMILNLLRGFNQFVNQTDIKIRRPGVAKGLLRKNITILGKGNIGSRVGEICLAFGMKVNFFEKGNNLIGSIRDADVVVNVLSSNPSTKDLLDQEFFNAFKKGSYFITVTSSEIYDVVALLKALDDDILAGVANDCGSIQFGDVNDEAYLKFVKHPKVLATPHIAHNSDVTDRTGNKMMIDNIEAYLNGKPINLVY